MNAAVSTEKLDVRIEGQPILTDVSIEVPAGSVVGLLGPSGSGKTTLMRTIVGLQRSQGGSVSVLGERAGSKQLRSQVGYMTQAPSVYGDLTVGENLHYFARLTGTGSRRIDEVLAEVEIGELSGRIVGTLSGGQRARVSLAVAMINSPKILILDEPTVGLDPVLRQQLWSKFRELAAAGTTLLISSHVMDEASRCDSLVLLRDGKVLATGSPSELQSRTKKASIEEAFVAMVGGAA